MTAHATIGAMLPVLLCVVLWPLLISAVRALARWAPFESGAGSRPPSMPCRLSTMCYVMCLCDEMGPADPSHPLRLRTAWLFFPLIPRAANLSRVRHGALLPLRPHRKHIVYHGRVHMQRSVQPKRHDLHTYGAPTTSPL